MNVIERLSANYIDKPVSLREQVSSSIRAALITGEMKPGQTFSVPMLAEKFGVSATPVREAILDLTKEGLFYALPNKGFRVVETSDDVLRELTEIRLLIEIPVHIQVAKTITQESIAELKEIATLIQRYAEKKDLMNFIDHDRRFHNGILKISGNDALVELSDQLRSKARMHALPFILMSGQLVTSAAEHFTILESMENKDFQSLARAVEHHINYTIDAINAHLAQ